MARVICPFCLKAHDFRTSPKCEDRNAEVPAVYINDYGRVPPLWLVTIGFSRHGKSCYLAYLTRTLEEISNVWDGVYYRPLDQYTFDAIQKIRRDADSGTQPDKTPRDIPRPLLFSVYNMPRAGSRCLVMYDVAGEIYDSLSDVKNFVVSTKHVTTTWFLVSLPDLEKDSQGKTITDLFSVYLSSMEKMNADLRGRNLIVIYTKGDKFPPRDNKIRDYLTRDPLRGLANPEVSWERPHTLLLDTYVEEMREISDELEDYTRKRVRGGAAFINMVRANGMKLAFSVVSALGSDPDPSNRLPFTPVPSRVIDPFLWAITLERGWKSTGLSMVLDASPGSDSIYSANLPVELADALSNHGELTTYFLGQAKPVSTPGQEQPKELPRIARPRLIGPVLKKMEPGARCMVISKGPIIDLDDYARTSWRDRVLLVTLDETYSPDWANTIQCRPNDDPVVLVKRLMELKQGE